MQPYAVPQMAIGFIYGPQLNQTLNDPTYMNISLLEINTTQGKGIQNPAQLYTCPQLDWMEGLQSFYQNLTCINTSTVSLQGLLYASPMSLYPRFIVTSCNNSVIPNNCQSYGSLMNMTAGGRMFLFVQKTQSMNLATGKVGQGAFAEFDFYNFFLIPGLYNRITITFQPTTYVVYPDYITSWTKKTYLTMPIVDQQFQTSNVTTYNNLDLLSISILLSGQSRINEVVYSTLIEHISLWGAFWGVLFSVFAFYFLVFNRNQFYNKNQGWDRFEDKMREIERDIRIDYQRRLVEMDDRGNRNNSLQVPLQARNYNRLDDDMDLHAPDSLNRSGKAE